MKAAAIIVAAGAGKRFGTKIPKQFVLLSGKPLYLWSVLAFKKLSEVKQVIVVAPRDRLKALLPPSKKYGFELACGGKERSDSVKSGLLKLLPEIDIVAIHDGARPMIRKDTIRKSLSEADKFGAAVVSVQAVDTVKYSGKNGFVARTIPRTSVWLAQTPQVFKRTVISRAYAGRLPFNVTDDAQAAELKGFKVRIVPGEYSNIKITGKHDLETAKTLIQRTKRK
ncbi:MAG TPA: 2-C-methyl-D-erythritol 4-phosphate cytidylyltransferase [Elusimicrobia bacterium]|nr:MAG: 2-C-methyl-D-erythritol 4-phosphate cytidylyltransferase [Elusimicrobia bacterium RIFOXYA12_FULL_49_49]OGS09491.1 MAG: 2-C-methyl-D-erythritol 4-phosphate cytidylyltransferase [Elusimicrobia bacterium RIFOXYA1_FULL_47_7]OGS15861.1 MAG: 2-C-methyl-D-erythritol 4-phosphate cytidylyltransferase [Elusimicrobia bacterium RIFOXYA2_FULL_47_53]OGS27155.1 MAG: 2-C-methyl-D-erythritol 4-phosphate cytidylyltransferase [Elusimicrobia bacterium RIFOXYB12_FULL_50_12]OGS31194.1 MAG: 2-C-methyl-D-eryth